VGYHHSAPSLLAGLDSNHFRHSILVVVVGVVLD
jgi:hypothetical protein